MKNKKAVKPLKGTNTAVITTGKVFEKKKNGQGTLAADMSIESNIQLLQHGAAPAQALPAEKGGSESS